VGDATIAVTTQAGAVVTLGVTVALAQPGIFAAIYRAGFLEIYCTGLGTPPQTPTVFFGATPVQPTFSGVAPGFIGLNQVNVQVPPGVAGTVPLLISIGKAVSNESRRRCPDAFLVMVGPFAGRLASARFLGSRRCGSHGDAVRAPRPATWSWSFIRATIRPAARSNCATFRDRWEQARTRGVEVFGVNPQSTEKHVKFRRKFGFPFPLLVDRGQHIAKLYHANGLVVKRNRVPDRSRRRHPLRASRDARRVRRVGVGGVGLLACPLPFFDVVGRPIHTRCIIIQFASDETAPCLSHSRQ